MERGAVPVMVVCHILKFLVEVDFHPAFVNRSREMAKIRDRSERRVDAARSIGKVIVIEG